MSDYKNDLIASLEMSPSVFRQFVSTIPEDHLDKKRCNDCWTPQEHIKHVAIVQPMLYNRLELVQKSEHPVVEMYLPDEQEKKQWETITIADALDSLDKIRNKQVELIRSFSLTEWERVIEHPEYELYNTEILIRHILAHDYWHLYRIEELWLTKKI